MTDVLLYTFPTCAFCERARTLLREHGVSWREHSLERDRELGARLARQLGRPAMPYALVDGELLGGLEELEERVARGDLQG